MKTGGRVAQSMASFAANGGGPQPRGKASAFGTELRAATIDIAPPEGWVSPSPPRNRRAEWPVTLGPPITGIYQRELRQFLLR